MKRILSFLLAALLMASSIVSCGNNGGTIKETEASDTKAVETKAPETGIPATDAPETTAPAVSYDTSLIVENGVAKAHIVLPDGASDFEKTAADELSYHIKLVTGADIAVTNAPQPDSLPIVIATPDSMPELEELFPEDLAWLRLLAEEPNEKGIIRRYGDDGFAIRAHEGKIYIFGATARGSLNGVYDFIEDNMDVLWIGNTDAGIIYDEMPTVTLQNTDYSVGHREKSPFSISWKDGNFFRRNKLSAQNNPYGGDANVKSLILESPTYDPNNNEYWDTDTFGVHVSAENSKQINFWSPLVAETIAARVIEHLGTFSDAERPKYYNVCMEDIYDPCIYPEMTEPFEYAPGQFVDPADSDYLSTVYFTFINRVAKIVGEQYPENYINTLAYMWATESPRCELEENVSVWFCTYTEDYTQESFAATLAKGEEGNSTTDAILEARYYENWINEHPATPMLIYNYYFTYGPAAWYERPIWVRLGNDFRYFAETGAMGSYSCTHPAEDSTRAGFRADHVPDHLKYTYGDAWSMNRLTLWILYRLQWNPYEDVDALIDKFCDKVYGDAAPYMKEYYDLIETGWNYGATEILPYEFNADIRLSLGADYYFMYFLDFELEDGTYFLDAVKNALNKAYEAADDKAKEFIRHPMEIFEDWTRFID